MFRQLRHIIGLVIVWVFTALSVAAMPMAPTAAYQAEFFAHQQAVVSERTNVHFAARAPPPTVADVAITGAAVAVYCNSLIMHEHELHVASLGFVGDFDAPNTGASRSPWTQVSSDARSVARDIESATGRALPQNQRNQLAEQLREVDHRNPVSDADYANLQREYRRNRTQMIRDWENNTGQSWPEGAQLHHVIPQRYGGPNQWWNAHPALPSQHQGGIHGTGSPTQTVFPTPVPRQ